MLSYILITLFLNKNFRFDWVGCDTRYPLEPDCNEDMERIEDIFYKKDILNQLNSSRISISDKLNIIDREFHSYTPSIYAAGLLEDWDFDIE